MTHLITDWHPLGDAKKVTLKLRTVCAARGSWVLACLVLANRVGFERRPDRPVYRRLRTLDRLRPLSWPGGPLYLGQLTPLVEVRQDRG